ncbi:hypothetical protein Tco_1087569 [Tanacetum coccineum]
MISPAFMEANYEILESLLRERQRQIRNEDLCTELEYFRFKEAPNREGGRIERNVKGGGPSKLGERENESRGINLPLLLAGHLGRSENGHALQSSLTSVYGDHQPSTNIGGNLPPNGTHLSHHAQPSMPSSLHPSNGFNPARVNSYP